MQTALPIASQASRLNHRGGSLGGSLGGQGRGGEEGGGSGRRGQGETSRHDIACILLTTSVKLGKYCLVASLASDVGAQGIMAQKFLVLLDQK
jgi:hypothetical protein